MGPPPDPVPSASELPESADVVIVGGGIIGASTALFLAQRGLDVLLCEKGSVAGEQSSRNWGWVRRMGRDERELPLIVESLKLWDGMRQFLGEDVGFRRSGILYLCADEREAAGHEDWLHRAGEYALDSRMIRGDELAALLPGATRRYPAALYTESDGRAEPQKAAPAIARAAMRAGAKIVQNCAVRGVDLAAGRVNGVWTEKGFVRAGAVVVAGGVWSSLFLRPLGLRLPQLAVRSSVLRTDAIEGGPEGAAWEPDFAYRKRLDGGYTIAPGILSRHPVTPDSFRFFFDFVPLLKRSWREVRLEPDPHFFARLKDRRFDPKAGETPFERSRTLDPDPDGRALDRAWEAFQTAFPAARGATVEQRWAGMIDATPDAVPVIAPVRSVPGLVVATGFSGHGFGIGPAAGRLAADLVTGEAPIVDPAPFRFERFSDGTKPRPTTSL